MFFTKPMDHVIPFFQQMRSLTLTFLYFKHLSLLMHDVYHQAVPSSLRGMFRITTDVHNLIEPGLHQTNIIMLSTLEQKK